MSTRNWKLLAMGMGLVGAMGCTEIDAENLDAQDSGTTDLNTAGLDVSEQNLPMTAGNNTCYDYARMQTGWNLLAIPPQKEFPQAPICVNPDLAGAPWMKWTEIEKFTGDAAMTQSMARTVAARTAVLLQLDPNDSTKYIRKCTATVIQTATTNGVTKNRVLTAAHCLDGNPQPGSTTLPHQAILFDYQLNATSGDIRYSQHDHNSASTSNYFVDQKFSNGPLQPLYAITGLLENGWYNKSPGVDYAIYEVGNNMGMFTCTKWSFTPFKTCVAWAMTGQTIPSTGKDSLTGLVRGVAKVSAKDRAVDTNITTIGHHGFQPKKVATGKLAGYDTGTAYRNETIATNVRRLKMKNLDVFPGSSGSGVYDSTGTVIGVVTWTDCAPPALMAQEYQTWMQGAWALKLPFGAINVATPMSDICTVSPIIKSLTNNCAL